MQPRAPRASALSTSWPERTPPSNSTSMRSPTAPAIAGSDAIEERAPSSWRPPWFETTMPSTPAAAASLASSTSRMPFSTSLARPQAAHPVDVAPVQRAVVIVVGPAARQHRALRLALALEVEVDIAERAPPRAQHVRDPARADRQVERVAHGQARRHGQAVLDVHVALAAHRQVDGDEQRRAVRRLGALDHRFAEAAVAEHVELVPERLRGRLAHVLDGADRHGGEAEPRAGGLRGARALHLAVACEQAGHAGRRDRDRQRQRSRRAAWSRPKSARRRPARAGAAGWRRGRRGWRRSVSSS